MISKTIFKSLLVFVTVTSQIPQNAGWTVVKNFFPMLTYILMLDKITLSIIRLWPREKEREKMREREIEIESE